MKNLVAKFAVAIAACTLTLAVAAPAMAQEGTFTVKQEVRIPRAVLAPGTYVFRQVGNQVVEVSEVGGHKIGLYLTLPTTKSSGVEKTELVLNRQRIESVHFADSDSSMTFIYPSKSE